MLKKIPDMLELKLVIMLFGLGPESHLFQADSVLLFLSDFGLFSGFIKEFPVIHYPAYGRFGGCGHLDQVKPPLLSRIQCLPDGNNSELRTVLVD